MSKKDFFNKKNCAIIIILLIILSTAFWFRSIPARHGELQAIDPFYFFRMGEYLVDNNLQLPEVDTFRHHPFGDTTFDYLMAIYPAPILYILISPIFALSFLSFVFFYTALLGVLSVLIMFFIGREIGGYKLGLLSALFLAVIPAFLARTSAGFYEKESIAFVFLLISTYFFIRAYKEGSWKYGILSGVFLGILGLSWGGALYLFGVYSAFAFILLIINKYSSNLLKSFLPTIIIAALILCIPVYRIPLTSPLVLLSFATLLILLIRYGAERFNWTKKENFVYIVPGILVIAVVGLLVGSMFSDTLLSVTEDIGVVFGLTKSVELTTVAESTPGSWNNIFQATSSEYSAALIPELSLFASLFPIWILAFLAIIPILYKSYKEKNYVLIFILMWLIVSITGIFYQIRLQILLGPPFALCAAYVLSYCIDDLNEKFKNKAKTKKYASGIFFMIFLVLTVLTAFSNILSSIIFGIVTVVMLLSFLIIIKEEEESFIKRLFKKITHHELSDKINIFSLVLVIFLILAVSVNISSGFVNANALGPSICFSRTGDCITINNDGTYDYNENEPWYQAMNFLKEETPKDSNILSWWDFGYWFQTRGERPSVSDGGGAGPRYDIAIWYTSPVSNWSSFEPWLKDRYGVDYILMDYTLPGKYGAISKIANKGEKIMSILQFDLNDVIQAENRTVYQFSFGPYVLWIPMENQSISGSPMILIQEGEEFLSKSYVNEICTVNGILRLGDNTPELGGCVAITDFGVFYVPEDEVENSIFTDLMFMDGFGLPVEKVFDNTYIAIYKVL